VLKRITPEILATELKKLNASIEIDYTVCVERETKKIDNKFAEMQKGY